MSESTSTPSTPAPSAPAPAAPPTTSAPAPASQPGISVSEAARLLSKQRRNGEAPPAPPAIVSKPSPNDVAAAAAKAASPASPAAKAPASPSQAPSGEAGALERLLGVTPPAGAEVPDAPADGAIVEIEGQRLRSLAEVQEFAHRKSADYTQKMQQLSAARQQVEAQQQALQAVLPYIQPELARLAQIVQHAPQRPDPAMLETDPQGYLRARAQYEQIMEEQGRIGSLSALSQQAQARAMEQAVAAANEQLAKEMPFWADPQQRLAAQQEIIAWATEKGGFSRDELRGLTSPHHLKTMMKAAMYDKMVSGSKTSAPRQVTSAPVRGTAPPPPPSERIQVAQQAFEEKPSIRSGAALLAARRRQ